MSNNYPNEIIAMQVLKEAEGLNNGPWIQHSQYVASGCKLIAEQCGDLNPEKAYVLGLLHDIGRRSGIVQEKHTIEGYKFALDHGWNDVAKVCLTHSYVIKNIKSAIGHFDITVEDYNFIEEFIDACNYDDYDLLVQLCDSVSLSNGFCLMEKRLVDVACRYSVNPYTIEKWQKLFEIKDYFENKMHCSIYSVLPYVIENTFYYKNS